MIIPNQFWAYLAFGGDFDPDTITLALELLPTESWKPGEKDLRHGGWQLWSRLSPSDSCSAQVKDVLAQVRNCRKLSAVCSDFKGWMQIVAHDYGDFVSFSVDRADIAEIANLGLAIDVDVTHFADVYKEGEE